MTKSILAVTLMLAFVLGTRAEQKAAQATKAASAAQPDAISATMSSVAEIGKILEERHVVYAPEILKSNVTDAVIAAIDPEGGAILTRDQAARRLDEGKGLFYGIGCKIRIKDKWPQIIEAVSNSPAFASGLRATNLIVKIGSHSTEGMRLEEVVKLLRGGKEEALELTIRADDKTEETPRDAGQAPSAAGQARTVKLTRSAIQTPVTGTTETWPQGIGYLKVNGLYTNSGAVIAEQLNIWRTNSCFGAILDIRGADGMDLESVAEIGGLFARNGDTLFTLRDGHNTVVATYRSKSGRPLDKPVMVLVDHDTSGAAEVLAGLLNSCKGAMLIGVPTRGDDRVRDIIPLSNGRVLYIATRRIELSKGPAYYQVGITPHVRVTQTNEPAGRDSEFADQEPDIFSGISDQERQDRALINRIDGDMILRRAADILLGLKALDFKVH